MVQKITEYQCDFPGCNSRYVSRKRAEKCESKESIGPEIKPGFTTGGLSSSGYMISLETIKDEGHAKIYSFIHITGSLNTMKFDEKEHNKNSSWHVPTTCDRRYNPSMLESFIAEEHIKLLDDKEFKVSEIIHNGEITFIIRNILEEKGIERLYRTHPYFDNPVVKA